MLKAADLSKRYEDGVLAVDHLNLDIPPGEVYCLLGANGAGKTTT
ncbi:MAG: ATP-binding cassette domain-containing protein, partial [Candidatus Aminicenantes bacterium]|nr:ATP-binding cassette domain-containing protein [Candidatus Aminicenantes bacterium]